jgi:hypothetical protein
VSPQRRVPSVTPSVPPADSALSPRSARCAMVGCTQR